MDFSTSITSRQAPRSSVTTNRWPTYEPFDDVLAPKERRARVPSGSS